MVQHFFMVYLMLDMWYKQLNSNEVLRNNNLK